MQATKTLSPEQQHLIKAWHDDETNNEVSARIRAKQSLDWDEICRVVDQRILQLVETEFHRKLTQKELYTILELSEPLVITVYFQAIENVRDIDWDVLSGKYIVMTPFWSNSMVFYSDTYSQEELESIVAQVAEFGGEDLPWNVFLEEGSKINYAFPIKENLTVRVVSSFSPEEQS